MYIITKLTDKEKILKKQIGYIYIQKVKNTEAAYNWADYSMSVKDNTELYDLITELAKLNRK